nr:cobalt ABC transporter ATP-binding protein [Bacillota bacterium]
MSTVIEARNVHFHYTPGVPVLTDVTLSIGPGATAIIGQNGAGKSTFVRLLNGLLKPVSGTILVNGVDTRTQTVASLARTVGLVFQNPSDQLFKSRVIDEVMFGPLNLGFSRDEAEARAREALAQVGLQGVETRNPYDLGLAERKLVTIASVLAMGTSVIILDEPTIAQDHAGVRRLGAIVDELAAAGRTVITITHDMNFVARHFRRVVVFGQGRVLADGDAASVFSRPDILHQTGLEAPQITRLAQALALGETPLTVEQFVDLVRRRLSGSA